MMNNTTKSIALIALVLLGFACGPRESETTATTAADTAATTAAPAQTTTPAADYDLQFIDTIMQHHEMAVQMGQMAAAEASDAKLKEFGRKVAEDQAKDIERLRSWREQWYGHAPKAVNTQLAGGESLNMKMSHSDAASGHELDMRFIDMMIPHHQGAIAMSREALTRAQRPELKQLAQETIAKQEKEIADLQAWKKSMGMPSASASAGLPSIDPLNVLATEVQRVEPKKVCMVNERYMADDQIPVNVGGKTYYGCCAMCKTALAQDASKRTAIDPVSKRPVDKAVAVIGADKRGRVYYFENEANLRAFTPPA